MFADIYSHDKRYQADISATVNTLDMSPQGKGNILTSKKVFLKKHIWKEHFGNGLNILSVGINSINVPYVSTL